MACSARLVFKGAVDPEALAAKLTKCVFLRRNPGTVIVHGSDVRCTFEQPMGRQKILKACAENFKKWASNDASHGYGEHIVDDEALTPAHGHDEHLVDAVASTGSDAAILAIRTSVEDIWKLAADLTPAECRSLAVRFALRGFEPSMSPELMPLVRAKIAAAEVFKEPVATWEKELHRHALAIAVEELVRVCECT